MAPQDDYYKIWFWLAVLSAIAIMVFVPPPAKGEFMQDGLRSVCEELR